MNWFESACWCASVTACSSVMACGSSPSADAGCASGVLVAVSDYSSSGVGVLPLDGTPAQLLFGTALGGDPALASSAGRSFYIERDQQQIIYEVDSCGRATAKDSSLVGTETSADPQDVAVASDGSLWVARFTTGLALVIGPSGGSSTLDLSSLAAAGGNPNMSSVRIAQTSGGEKAFFTLERLDNTNPNLPSVQPSQMAIVDTKTHAVELVPLQGRNPFGQMTETPGTFWLADLGNSNADNEPDAGIESFSIATRTSSLLISESTIGGSVGAVAVRGTCGAAIAWDAVPLVNHTFLVSFDTSGNLVQTAAFGPTTGFDLAGVVWTEKLLLVGDRRSIAKGFAVHTFTADTHCNLSQGADLYLPMPPVAFLANGL